ncbi:MAG: T9SS type A sorting domain-containing protein [Candidatus Cloacimonetes bacterium]|nr:T9SS type A sorting domain-containing protein [Candidatus Cloacimonadota bacterium]
MKRKKEKQSKGWLTITILLGIIMIIPQMIWSTDISEGYIYSTNSSGHNPYAITGENFNPQIYYYSGEHNRTYFTWMQKGGAGYSLENMVFYYDHDTEELSESYGVVPGTQGATDTHGHGAIIVADDGHIIVIHEKLWNAGPSAHNGEYQMKRSILPEDPSGGFELVHTTGFGNCYPKIWKTDNGDLFVSSRYGSDAWADHYRVMLYKSTDNGLTWDAGTVIVNFGTAANYWAYHSRIIQSDSDGINIVINRVDRDPNYSYADCYYLRSEDGVIWTNIDNSYTKDVSTQGSLNSTEMDNYYLVDHSNNVPAGIGLITGCISTSNNIYLAEMDGTMNPCGWFFMYWEDEEWQKIEIPNNNIRIVIWGMYSYSDEEFDIIVNNWATYEIERWKTTDKGLTWNIVEEITSNSDYDLYFLQMVMNLPDSPYFALSANYLSNTSYADVFIMGRENWTVDIDEQIIPSIDTNAILHQNFPNPFKPSGAGRSPATTISYSLSNPSDVSLSLYNIKGELIETLVNENQQVGDHSVVWNAEDVSSGVYFYQIKTDETTETKKCVIIK